MLTTALLSVAAHADPAAMGESLVFDIGGSLLIAGLLAALFTRFKIPTIAAFLFAGVFVGPQVTGLVTSKANIETIAHLGLVLLLFLIGLEIDLKKLLSSGKTLIWTGLLQFPLCVAFGFGATWLLQKTGWAAIQGPFTPLYLGITVAASSTLLIVKLFQEKYQLDTTVGRMVLGLLIFQDLWAMVVLAVQPNFSQPDLQPVLMTLLGIGILVAIASVFARYVLPTAFHWIARSPELMLVTAIGWCFGIGLLGTHLGEILGMIGIQAPISVSLEMGALIAGASIASFPYCYEVLTKVSAVRDFFVTLFFVGLGMGIPKPDGSDILLLALLMTGLAILSRYLIFLPLLHATGFDRRGSVLTATRMVPISEFCLVIAYLGLSFGHLPATTVGAVIFAFVLTALLYPSLFQHSDALYQRMAPMLTRLGMKAPANQPDAETPAEEYELVLLGFHRIASSLFYELERTNPELLKKTLVVDFNVALHPEIERRGATAHYGDISNPETLRHAGVDKAGIILCTIPDDILKGTSNLALTKSLRVMCPTATIITNAVQTTEVRPLYEAGADYVFVSRVDSARNLMPALDAAVLGAIAAFKENQEFQTGKIGERREVLT
ncbi:cation:proton antiporter [bacterium]|nr:cation:proton antiporter [bacterium]